MFSGRRYRYFLALVVGTLTGASAPVYADLGTNAGYQPGSIVSPEPYGWSPMTGGGPNGHDAIRSGALPGGASSTAQLTLTGPGILTFDWRVSSEADADWL